MVAKSAGMGTWVMNRIEFVGPAIAADAIKNSRRIDLFTSDLAWLSAIVDPNARPRSKVSFDSNKRNIGL
jgi:hypothetical protein